MYAVIRTGGKQYRVSEGDVVRVERLEEEVGSEITFDDVLLLSGDQVHVGSPMVDGARVKTTVVEQGLGTKVVAFKKKRRKGYRRKKGHRQPFTAIRVDTIVPPGASSEKKGKTKASGKDETAEAKGDSAKKRAAKAAGPKGKKAEKKAKEE